MLHSTFSRYTPSYNPLNAFSSNFAQKEISSYVSPDIIDSSAGTLPADNSDAFSSGSEQQKDNFQLNKEGSAEPEKGVVSQRQQETEPVQTKTQEFLKEAQEPKQISERDIAVSSVSTEGALFSNIAISECLLKLGYPEKSLKSMLRCGEKMGQLLRQDGGCPPRFVEMLYPCNLRTCVRCSKIRQRHVYNQYIDFLNNLSYERGRREFAFLTISPKNYDNCKDGLKAFKKGLRALFNTHYVLKRTLGCLAVIETTEHDNGWHIHGHCIIYGSRLDNQLRGHCFDCGQNLVKFEYQTKKYFCANKKCNSTNLSVIQDSTMVRLCKRSFKRDVNVHVSNHIKTKSGTNMPMSKCPAFTLNYMLKYVLEKKEQFSSIEKEAEYIFSTRKQKLIIKMGLFFNYPLIIPKPLCNVCNTPVFFTYDFQITMLIIENEHKPPPQDLTIYDIYV